MISFTSAQGKATRCKLGLLVLVLTEDLVYSYSSEAFFAGRKALKKRSPAVSETKAIRAVLALCPGRMLSPETHWLRIEKTLLPGTRTMIPQVMMTEPGPRVILEKRLASIPGDEGAEKNSREYDEVALSNGGGSVANDYGDDCPGYSAKRNIERNS